MEDLLIRGSLVVLRWDDPARVLPDGGLLVRDATILELGPFADLRGRNPRATVIGDGTHLVIPGFVNAHSHGRGLSTIVRGVADQPLEFRVPAMRTLRSVDPYWDTLLSCVRQLEHGITGTMHVDSYYGGESSTYRARLDQVLSAYAESGIRFSLALGVRDQHFFAYIDDQAFLSALPPEERRAVLESLPPLMDGADYVRLFDDLVERLPGAALQFGPTNPVWCSDNLLRRISQAARERRARVHIHLLETPYQREYALRAYGGTAVQHFADIGFLWPGLTCAHCVWVSETDIALLHAADVLVVHNPSSNLRLGSGIAPMRAIAAAGVRVGVGLDSLSLSDEEDMLGELRLASLLQRLPLKEGNGPILRARTILQWASETGAASLGDDRLGRLEAGYLGDLVLMRFPSRHEVMSTVDDVAESLLTWPHAFRVDTVVVGGRVVVQDGRHVGRERGEIAQRARDSLGPPASPPWPESIWARIRAVYAEWLVGADPFSVVNSRP